MRCMTQVIDLAAWMSCQGIKDPQLADDIERTTGKRCSRYAVKKWRLKQRVPRPQSMKAIIQISGGQVTADSFYPHTA